jgi:hypothetical protein
MSVTGNTELAPTKQDLIAAAVQRELRERSFLTQHVTDVSGFAGKGMKSISFPRLSSFSVQLRASAAAGNLQALSASVDTLDLNLPAYVSWLLDSNDDIQSTIDYQVEAAMFAARAHGRFVDDEIVKEALTVASLSVNGATPADIDRDAILEMRRYLIENNADMSQVVLVVPPSQEEALLKVNQFTAAEVYGSAVIPSGVIGRVYGIPVLIHNSSELDDADENFQQAVMFDKSGLAIGFQRSPNFDEQKAIEYGTGAMRQALDQLLGIKGMQLGVSTPKHTVGATVSPLVAKLAD